MVFSMVIAKQWCFSDYHTAQSPTTCSPQPLIHQYFMWLLLIPPLLQLFKSMVFSILILVIVVIVTYSVHHRQKLHG